MVKFEQPPRHPRLVVYLDLKRHVCARLFPSDLFYSEGFELGGHMCYFHAQCVIDQQQKSLHWFMLYLAIEEKESVHDVFDYKFVARSKPAADHGNKKTSWYGYLFGISWTWFIGRSKSAEEFEVKSKGSYACTGGKEKKGYEYLFRIPWTSFIEEDSVYFIDGVLHLKLELTYYRSWPK
ncbi:hypothetical protein Hanom_Chr16g01486461 [Helianthus anomalus]